MAEDTSSTGNELQFERVVTDQLPPAANGAPAVVCAGCQARLEAEYYEINGRPFCTDCREKIEAVAETPRGLMPLAIAAIFGLGAALAGAAIYYAVIAITHFEIGLVAILIGYMVGYAVRKGRRRTRRPALPDPRRGPHVRSGRTGLHVAGRQGGHRSTQVSRTRAEAPPAPVPSAGQSGTVRHASTPCSWLCGVALVLPILVVIGSMPSGIITALIIFFGIRQAMRMTAAPRPADQRAFPHRQPHPRLQPPPDAGLPQCGTEVGHGTLACPACGALIHAQTLKELASNADRATQAGELLAAREHWQRARSLLPLNSRQHAMVGERIAELNRRIDGEAQTTPGIPQPARRARPPDGLASRVARSRRR